MTQLDLLTGKPAAAAEKPLTQRQQQVLELVIAAGRDGVLASDVGAMLHERRGRHPADLFCGFCSDDGKDALRALQRRKLVVRRRTGRWTVAKPKRKARR